MRCCVNGYLRVGADDSMVNPHHVVIEVYVCIAIINAFLGITQEIYSEAHEGESIRSPFTQEPISDTIDPEVSQLDWAALQHNLTNPTNATGGPIDWISDNVANFEATVALITGFMKFFTAGYIVDLLKAFGFPGEMVFIVTVPLGIYTAYMILVLITNRLGN